MARRRAAAVPALTGSRARVAVVLAAAAMALAACAGGGESSQDPSPDTPGRVALRPSTTIAVDDLYRPPDPLPAGEPGDPVATEELEPPVGAPRGTVARRLLYLSTGVGGDPVAVTGVVAVPPGDAGSGGRPVLAWAHGTTGIADACAPSRLGTAFPPFASELLAAGFVLVATDYEGLGTPGTHPYLVGASGGRSILDSARAAARLEGAGAAGPVVVLGHSQGGHAALFAALLAPRYAPDVPLAGVVAGAPPTDLGALVERISSDPRYAGFAAMAARAWTEVYPDVTLAAALTPEAVAALGRVDRECALEVLVAYASIERVVARDPRLDPAWAARLAENSPGPPPAGVPVLVVQGAADDLVPAEVTRRWARGVCDVGGTSVLEAVTYAGATHVDLLERARGDVLAWIAARVAGEQLSGCVTRSAS